MKQGNQKYLSFFILVVSLACTTWNSTSFANSWSSSNFRVTEELERQGIDTSPSSLQSLILDPTIKYNIRYSAAASIGQSKGPEARSFLLSLLEKGDGELMTLGLTGLAELRDPATVKTIGNLLRTAKSKEVVDTTSHALRTIGGAEVYDEFVSIAVDTALATTVRVRALGYLQTFRKHAPDERIEKILNSQNHDLHYAATSYLSQHFGNKIMAPHLVQSALDDRLDREHWIQAVRKLQQISEQDFSINSDSYLNLETRKRTRAVIKKWAAGKGMLEL